MVAIEIWLIQVVTPSQKWCTYWERETGGAYNYYYYIDAIFVVAKFSFKEDRTRRFIFHLARTTHTTHILRLRVTLSRYAGLGETEEVRGKREGAS